MSYTINKKPVVLFLEDHPDAAELLCRELADVATVRSASSGSDVRPGEKKGEVIVIQRRMDEDGEKTEEEYTIEPDFYIFDLRMPGETGIQIWERLGKPEKYAIFTVWGNDDYWMGEIQKCGMESWRLVSKDSGSLGEAVQTIKRIMVEDKVIRGAR
ncbi:MAG: hypothetical protein HQK57_00370 [Deltaproteobacteria bacterium]|nr:hypothetical protein [Deltaproteobacteria bacterium]